MCRKIPSTPWPTGAPTDHQCTQHSPQPLSLKFQVTLGAAVSISLVKQDWRIRTSLRSSHTAELRILLALGCEHMPNTSGLKRLQLYLWNSQTQRQVFRRWCPGAKSMCCSSRGPDSAPSTHGRRLTTSLKFSARRSDAFFCPLWPQTHKVKAHTRNALVSWVLTTSCMPVPFSSPDTSLVAIITISRISSLTLKASSCEMHSRDLSAKP